MKRPRWYGAPTLALVLCVLAPDGLRAGNGVWTSAAEIASIPAEGCAWDRLFEAADAADAVEATVSDQTSDNNVEILAAAIVHARLSEETYRDTVVAAVERLVAEGEPGGRTLAWAREAGAYAAAADLVGYRTPELESWLRNLAEVWVAEDNRTLFEMYRERPNNWGAHAFGSLAAIYVYVGDDARLDELHEHWRASVLGPQPPETEYGDDLSWHTDETDLRWINPAGAQRDGLSIDGVIPDDMRRNGPFAVPPPNDSPYHWEGLQGLVMAARILDRSGRPIWQTSDAALRRAFTLLQETWEDEYGGWKAEGDDIWMLPFVDGAYGTEWSSGYDPCDSRLFAHGKNAGWGWVTLGEPARPELELSGSCPGPMTLEVTGGTPAGAAGLLGSPEAGDAPLAVGPCAGVETGLDTPRLLTLLPLDDEGRATLTRDVSPARCGGSIQAIDGVTCTLSDPRIVR